MGLRQQQDVLARLYTDTEFRVRFFAEPEKNGLDAGLSFAEINEISEILPTELSYFSDSLISKRLREVRKLLPLTVSVSPDFDDRFRVFSSDFNPKSVKKHLEDALAFSKWLGGRDDVSALSKNVAKLEMTKLQFYSESRWFTACSLSFDLRPVNRSDMEISVAEPKRRRSIAIWIRFRNRTFHWVV